MANALMGGPKQFLGVPSYFDVQDVGNAVAGAGNALYELARSPLTASENLLSAIGSGDRWAPGLAFLDYLANVPGPQEALLSKLGPLAMKGVNALREVATPATYIGVNAARRLGIPEVGALAGTKVVDDAGKPLRVFHGTNKEIDSFVPNKPKSDFEGIYFTKRPEYAGYMASSRGEGSAVYPSFLDLRNPIDIDAVKKPSEWRKLPKDLKEAIVSRDSEALKRYGYDGIIEEGSSQYIAFNPSQIHNALAGPPETYPTGTFSSLYDRTPMVEISDKGAKISQPFKDDIWSSLKGFYEKYDRAARLPEVLEHPELVRSYPDFRNITVGTQEHPGGSLTPGISPESYSAFLGPNSDKPTLIHELQHAVQEREGWARGGSTGLTDWTSPSYRPQLLKAAQETMSEWKPASYQTFWGDEVTEEGQKAYNKYLKEWNSKEGQEKRWRAAQEGAPAKLYKNLLGEIQARDAAARNALSQEQLTTNPPFHPLAGQGGLHPSARWGPMSTENIPLADAIVRRR